MSRISTLASSTWIAHPNSPMTPTAITAGSFDRDILVQARCVYRVDTAETYTVMRFANEGWR